MEAVASNLAEVEEPSEMEEYVEMNEEEWGGEGEEEDEIEEAVETMEEERDGGVVVDEGAEKDELVTICELVMGDEEVDRWTEERNGIDDGSWEEFKDGIVEVVKETGWTEGEWGGMEIGEGEGGAEGAGAVLGWFIPV